MYICAKEEIYMKARTKIIIAVAAVLLGAVVVAAFFLMRNFSVEDVLRILPSSVPIAILALICIYCLKNLLMFIPVVALYLAAGIMFTPGVAIGVTYLCLFCEFSLGYLVGWVLGRGKVRALVEKRPKSSAVLHIVDEHQTTACFLTRIIPLPVPLDLMSMFYGSVGVPYLKYIVSSLLGVSAFMLPCVLAGDAVLNPLSAEFILPFSIAVASSVGAFLIYTFAQRRKKMRENGVEGQELSEDEKRGEEG